MDYVKRLVVIIGISSMLGFSHGCASAKPGRGDTMVAQLRLGMTKEDVTRVLGTDRAISKFSVPNDLYTFLGDVVPYDLPRHIPEGAETWTYGYWVNSNTQNTIDVFFSKENRVIGWTKQHSKFSREKYQHERLTSQLSHGMSQEKVRKLLGSPNRIIAMPSQESREIYSDHYWHGNPVLKGIDNWPMWVYSYSLSEGRIRNVYLAFNNRNKLDLWGYDHAREEAERYLRERAGNQ